MKWPLSRWLPHDTTFDFVRVSPVAAVLSALLILGSIASFATQGLNLGIDFTGGTQIEVSTPNALPLGALRAEVARSGVGDAQVQGIGGANAAMVRFKPKGDAAAAVAALSGKLQAAFPGLKIKPAATVGAKVSGELFRAGFMALGVAMALMLVYIGFRFGVQQGLGAVIGVFHDVLLTLGILSVLRIEFSTESIVGLLTVIGYSMNEKVITFDRLRENLVKYRRSPLRQIINLSENERLSRTVITGTTALLALSGALFMGGPALFPLVFTMAFGIVVGTYSSIFVALPVILLWGVKRADDGPAAPIDMSAATRSGRAPAKG
jgi:preprotein translocase subunit SecF